MAAEEADAVTVDEAAAEDVELDGTDTSKSAEDKMTAVELCEGASEEDVLLFAQALEAGERWVDMADVMTLYLKNHPLALSNLERDLFSYAWKQAIDSHRTAWQQLHVLKQRETDTERRAVLAGLQAASEEKAAAQCAKVQTIVARRYHEEIDGQVFFAKMGADYHRYLAEMQRGKEEPNLEHVKHAVEGYDEAMKLAEHRDGLKASHPVRVSLVLNYCSFHYHLLDNRAKAIDTARSLFDEAVAQLSSLPDDKYQSSVKVLELLRESLEDWEEAQERTYDPDTG